MYIWKTSDYSSRISFEYDCGCSQSLAPDQPREGENDYRVQADYAGTELQG